MRVSESIHLKLSKALTPERLDVIDESHLHEGHAGAREGGQSHFRLFIVATAFEGLPRVARQRLVNVALREELAGPVHALAMKTLTPAEAAVGS